jgi:hypothetical protein
MEIISKKDAIKNKQIYYFTGKPCKHGHISVRLVKGGNCKECKEKYRLHYRATNLESIREKARVKARENYSTENRRMSYRNNVESELFYHAKDRAKRKGLEFSLVKEDIVIPDLCPVFGTPINFDDKKNVPTLDRIDSSKGYTKENIKVISFRANRLKDNGTIEEFMKIIDYMKDK